MDNKKILRIWSMTLLAMGMLLFLYPLSLFAHQGGDVAGGLLSGLKHPVTGLDHVVAMIAVGLWGAQLKSSAIWVLPVTFPVMMAVGGALGVAGLPLPGIEVGIAISSVILGAVVMLEAKPKLWLAMILVAFFAIFHGYAHGKELPHSVQPMAYGLGFVVMTGLLHLSGILIGTIYKWKAGILIVRVLGGMICLAGLYFLIQTL